MIGERQRRLLRRITMFVVCTLAAVPAIGETPRLGAPGRAERNLAARGFDLDTASLVEVVRSGPDLNTRMDALDVLSWRPAEDVKEPLVELLASESDPLVRRALAVALARFAQASALEILRAALRESASDLERTYLAATLAKAGDFAGYPILTAAVVSESSTARDRARRALFDLAASGLPLEPPVDVPSMLLEALEDPEPLNRRAALSMIRQAVLGGLGAELFVGAVEHLVSEDADPEIQERAGKTLDWFESMSDPRVRKAFELLRQQMRERAKEPPP